MSERRRPARGRPNVIDVTVRVPADKVEALKSYASRISRQRSPISRDEVVAALHIHADIFLRFGVKGASLFGSVVRDEARPMSDVDLMVDFLPGQPGGLFRYVELKHALEGVLGRPVDLITRNNIKPRLKARILAECLPVFGDEVCEP
ncbi:nucleotidyltransferase family protein [Magnetospirillum sulfuroxidans]|uniref:Nucleotidyltransferase family protein n=1 Tax=Magnetospirillum sulfuroxidans TaxID=611300 RepID=A0ABS5IGD6_9PROT|nr:nucleotidyltransferase family protein [Magnetospirillum sulfuroxidans]MBR9973476.1 nucleotidyltransferase family protein [Magnetospirillum sulfuroxidans]